MLKNTIHTLLTDFICTSNDEDALIFASYKINNVVYTQKLRLAEPIKNDPVDACLLKAEDYRVPGQEISTILITDENKPRPYYHVMRLFDQNLSKHIVAFDICDLSDARHFLEMNSVLGIRHLPFVNVPTLLLR